MEAGMRSEMAAGYLTRWLYYILENVFDVTITL